jgi:hypothetical protein
MTSKRNGTLWQSSVRERNYTGESIKRFLTRIKQLNPSMELDETYADLVAGKFEAYKLTACWQRKTGRDVEKYILRAKGETWQTQGTIGTLFNEL